MKHKILMTPGPSPVPSFVRAALAAEIIHHRTEEFRAILGDVSGMLKEIFCTKNPVLTLASSGTGAMEAAVSNLFSPHDKVLGVYGGKFGERWVRLAQTFSLDVVVMDVTWGQAPAVKEIVKILDENKGIKAVLTTLCETSTATVYDIEAIAKLTRDRGILLVVDAISGLGQDVLRTDDWGVDVVVSASQKGMMLPPGLAFISLNEKAQAAVKNSRLPKYYFDLNKALKDYPKNDTPFTPAVSLIIALRESLAAIIKEGVENRWSKFEKMAYAAQEAGRALGLAIFSRRPSASVTALIAPASIKSSDIVKKLRKEHGVSIAAGQDEIKDKIFRIAHMGAITEEDLKICFSLLEKVLAELGYNFKEGAALSRLKEVFHE